MVVCDFYTSLAYLNLVFSVMTHSLCVGEYTLPAPTYRLMFSSEITVVHSGIIQAKCTEHSGTYSDHCDMKVLELGLLR